MKFSHFAIAATAALALPTAAAITAPASAAEQVMGPAEAIAAVAASPDHAVTGTFEMDVASGGASGFDVYLNSAEDFRDPGNLTILLKTEASNALQEELGNYADMAMKGMRVRVTGTARRVETGPGAYQTRIQVDKRSQLLIL